MESLNNKVVITGVTGFLGSMVCHEFLRDGSYQVRGTVRDKNNEKKMGPLRKAFGELYDRVEFVEADLLNPESLEKAVEGCQYVVHTASPFPRAQPRDENELIKPAVEGTLAVMRAAHKFKVKRVVITSSVASVMHHKPEDRKDSYNESDWTDTTTCEPYSKSKTLAEKAAWEFQQSLPEDERFEIVTINPSFIIGPTYITTDFTSGEIIKTLMTKWVPGMPRISLGVVDVRDCAKAHLQALKVPSAANKRFILNNRSYWMSGIAQVLHKYYGQWYSIPRGEIKYCTLKMASFFVAEARLATGIWNIQFDFENKQSRELLGIEYRDPEESFQAMVESLIEGKIIPEKRKK